MKTLFCLIFGVASGIILFLLHSGGTQIINKQQQSQLLQQRIQYLVESSRKHPVLRFNKQQFQDYVFFKERTYSVIVMLTALAPQRQCAPCRQLSEEFTLVARSLRAELPNNDKVFFVLIDYDVAPNVFHLLNQQSAPIVMHISSKSKPKTKHDVMKFQDNALTAESIAAWVSQKTNIHITLRRPPNYTGAMIMMALFGLVGCFLYVRRNNLEFLYNSTVWGIGALLFCFLMTSGQMWNHIRGPPFMYRGRDGSLAYVHGSSQGQFIVESYIVLFLNAATVIGVVCLTEAAKPGGDSKSKRIWAVVGLVLLSVFFSLLLSLFRSKTQGYPYSFLFK